MSNNTITPKDVRREDWETPQALFEQIDAIFHFDYDVCANAHNTKVKAYFFTENDDALLLGWAALGHTFWMNPPYGRGTTEQWVRKAHEESQKGATIVALIPASVGTVWWRKWIDEPGHEVTFINGRIRFEGAPSVASFDSALVVFRPRLPKRIYAIAREKA